MSELTRYTAGAVSRDARRAGRQVSRGRLDTQVRLAAADDATDLAMGKVEDLTMATGSAMQSVARVASAQRQLEQLVPEASARLAFLADDHVLGCAELLGDLRRDLRRIR